MMSSASQVLRLPTSTPCGSPDRGQIIRMRTKLPRCTYASKIIDHIIVQEGFEHVLAVDYDKEIPTRITAKPHFSSSVPPP